MILCIVLYPPITYFSFSTTKPFFQNNRINNNFKIINILVEQIEILLINAYKKVQCLLSNQSRSKTLITF